MDNWIALAIISIVIGVVIGIIKGIFDSRNKRKGQESIENFLGLLDLSGKSSIHFSIDGKKYKITKIEENNPKK